MQTYRTPAPLSTEEPISNYVGTIVSYTGKKNATHDDFLNDVAAKLAPKGATFTLSPNHPMTDTRTIICEIKAGGQRFFGLSIMDGLSLRSNDDNLIARTLKSAINAAYMEADIKRWHTL